MSSGNQNDKFPKINYKNKFLSNTTSKENTTKVQYMKLHSALTRMSKIRTFGTATWIENSVTAEVLVDIVDKIVAITLGFAVSRVS